MSGSAARYCMGRETFVERDIFDVVAACIDSGISVSEFLEIVREAWDYRMGEKAKQDDRALTKAKAT